jgi:thiol:disulfide interchange protein DsbA
MRISVRLSAVLLVLAWVPCAFAASNWVEGTNYFVIQPQQPTSVPAGKIEVTEVFSYACPACNAFYPIADRLKASLPKDAVMDYVSAGFIPTEDWPMFQRAYYTSVELGIWSPRVHDAMFNAVWKTGELATMDYKSERLKVPAPTIEDAARFYARETGVSAAKFVATAHSFAVDAKVREADQYIQDCGVDSTPTLIVNGKYRLTAASAGGYEQTIALVDWLVSQEKPHH